MKVFNAILKKLSDLSTLVCFAAVLLMVLVIAVDTFGTFFRHPLIGNMEIVVVLMVCIVFLGVAECARTEDMIKVDIFKGWPWLDHFSYIVTALLGFLICYETIIQAFFSKSMNQQSAQLDIPNWPFILVTAFGFFMVGLSGVSLEMQLIHKARAAKKGENALPEAETGSEPSGKEQ